VAEEFGHKDVAEVLRQHSGQRQAPPAQPVPPGQQTSTEVRAKAAKAANPSLDAEKVQALFNSAARDGNAGLLQQMLELGADPNTKNFVGMTPLHNAAAQGYKSVAELLLAHGADVNAEDGLGNTPLHNAELKGYKDLAELLRKHGGK
jgi:ankyrin repeat protein